MVLVNHLLKVPDKSDCEGRKGPVEIYVCGLLIEIGVWKVMMKRQTSCILSTTIESTFYIMLDSFFGGWKYGAECSP